MMDSAVAVVHVVVLAVLDAMVIRLSTIQIQHDKLSSRFNQTLPKAGPLNVLQRILKLSKDCKGCRLTRSTPTLQQVQGLSRTVEPNQTQNYRTAVPRILNLHLGTQYVLQSCCRILIRSVAP